MVYPATNFQGKTFEVFCDSGHVGENFPAMVFVVKIRISILCAEDDVVNELMMCAGHIIVLFLFRPSGAFALLIDVCRCFTAQARVVLARRALMSFAYPLAFLAPRSIRHFPKTKR